MRTGSLDRGLHTKMVEHMVLWVSALVSMVILVQGEESSEAFTPHTVISRDSYDGGHYETWGYTEVREGARLFWWLHHTTHPAGYKQRPLVLWHQGGPGVSGVGYGSFDIIGPLDVDLNPRNTTWLQSASLLFVDSPVGSGYSHVTHDDLLTSDVTEATADLMTFTKIFFDENSDFKTVPYYIFSQSYGGKFATEYAWALQQEINSGTVVCDLCGYALGNSWVDPVESILGWAPELLQMSVVDEPGYEAIHQVARQSEAAAAAGEWAESTRLWAATQGVVHEHTNGIDWYNILNYNVDSEDKESDWTKAGRPAGSGNTRTTRAGIRDFYQLPDPVGGHPRSNLGKLIELMNGPIREKVGIVPDDVTWVWSRDEVFDAHAVDFMKDTLDTVDLTLMETNMTVVVYQGQLDLICNAKAAMRWVQKLKWPGLEAYNNAERHALTDPLTGQTDTYVKANGRFKFYWNLRTGHAVPTLLGDAALRMLNRIFEDTDH